MKTLFRNVAILLLLFLGLPGQPAATASQVSVGGYVLSNATPLCALVLVNGQTQFSCDGTGRYDMQVPLDENGLVTVMVFADGFAPFNQILPPDQASEYPVAMVPDQQSPSLQTYAAVQTSAQEGRFLVTGVVVSGSRPVCALVLANGSNLFSCGESLGQFSLDVPSDEQGNITLMIFAAGFKPYKQTIVADPDTDGDGNADRLDEDDDNDGVLDVNDICPLLPEVDCPEPITDTVVVEGREWAQVDLFTGLSWSDIADACPPPPDFRSLCLPGAVLNGKDMTGWRWASAYEFNSLVNFYIGARALGRGPDRLDSEPTGAWNEPPWFGKITRAFRYSSIRHSPSNSISGWLPILRPGAADGVCAIGMVGVNTYYDDTFHLESRYDASSRDGGICSEPIEGIGAWFYRDLTD